MMAPAVSFRAAMTSALSEDGRAASSVDDTRLSNLEAFGFISTSTMSLVRG